MFKGKYLKDEFPEYFEEIDKNLNKHINLEKLGVYSNKIIHWFGKCGHQWSSVIASRTNRKSRQKGRCPFCSGKKVLTGITDFASTEPELFKEVHPDSREKATQLSRGSKEELLWICELGHVYKSRILNRTSINKSGCSVCNGKDIFIGFNDFGSKRPEYIEEWDPENELNPYEVMEFSGKKVKWICKKCNNRYIMTVANKSIGNGCRGCSDEKRRNTMYEKYGYEYASQVPEFARKASLKADDVEEIPHWKTREKIIAKGGYEKKVIKYFNENKIDFIWQIVFKIPEDVKDVGGKTYRIDAYLPDEDTYIEVKGHFRGRLINKIPISKLKWDWFHATYPNSELWDRKKLRSMGIKVK